jgi:mediator of RNA polymerase II transcription subunit 5
MIETFLIPSLVGAITWMTSYALEQTHKDLPVIIQILHKVVRPSSISGDSQAMHSTILSIVSRRLDICLKTLQRRGPLAQDLQPLIDHIKPNLSFERTAYSPTSELETWTTSPTNTLKQTIRSTISNLVVWSATASIHLNPTNYTHRLFYVSSKLLGAKKTLRAILEEVKAQTEAGNGSIALDIATAVVCAPSTENSPIPIIWPASPVPAPLPPRTRLNLAEMLTVEFNDAADLLSSDSVMAETISRLHRRVQAQLAMATLPDLVAQPIMATIDMAVEDAEVAAAAAAVAGGLDQQSLDAMDLTGGGADDLASLGLGMDMDMDMDGTGLRLDVGVGGTGADGLGDLSAGDLGSMDDVFSGLDMDPDLNF